MSTDRSNRCSPGTSAIWLLGLLVEIALILGAFWFLLKYRYSPETYRTEPIDPGTVELAWFTTTVIGAIFALAWFRTRVEACRQIVRACLPLALVSAFAVGRGLADIPMQCYDAILFSVACGWTALGRPREQPYHRQQQPLTRIPRLHCRLGRSHPPPQWCGLLRSASVLTTTGSNGGI